MAYQKGDSSYIDVKDKGEPNPTEFVKGILQQIISDALPYKEDVSASANEINIVYDVFDFTLVSPDVSEKITGADAPSAVYENIKGFDIKVANTNTGATNLVINKGTGEERTIPVIKSGNNALVGGELVAGDVVRFFFNEISVTLKAQIITYVPDNIETVSRTIYVATTGNDTTGDGSVGLPFETVTHALSTIKKVANNNAVVTIQLASGVYNENVSISNFSTHIKILGGVDLLNALNYVLTQTSQLTITKCKYVHIQGIKLTGSSNAEIGVDTGSTTLIRYCHMETVGTIGVAATFGCNVEVNDCKISNKTLSALYYDHSSAGRLSALEGDTNLRVYYSVSSMIVVSGGTITGTSLYVVGAGGTISAGGTLYI